MKCSICGKEFNGEGNNINPILSKNGNKCCNQCNEDIVIPTRLARMSTIEKLEDNVNYLSAQGREYPYKEHLKDVVIYAKTQKDLSEVLGRLAT